jgi:hypothetical protein
MYKECLAKRKEFRHIQTAIRSHGHQIGVYEQNKTSLSPLDTKKWIAADGITTRAYGHYLCRPADTAGEWQTISTRFAADRANSMWRKFSLTRDNHKLFTNEAPLRCWCFPLVIKCAQHIGGALVEIVESGLAGLAENIIDGVDCQRPHGVRGPAPAALQLARLVQVANHISPTKIRLPRADHAARRGMEGLRATDAAFIATEGFFPVKRVGSSLMAATTAGKARTHSRERSDEPLAANSNSCAY